MGGGGKKAHESFVVAPAAAGVPEGLDGVSEADLEALESHGAAAEALAAYDAALAKATAATQGDAGPAEAYQALAEAVGEASAQLQSAADAGLPPQLVAEHHKALTGLTKEYLGSLDPAELQSLAAAHGFEHPTLVGLNTAAGGQHPLVHWLDPAYGPGSPSKLAIQAKAAERYGELAAGATIGGLSLADVQAAEAAMATPASSGGWAATPAEALKASAALHQALAEFNPHAAKPTGDDGGLAALVAAENHLATAQSAELGSDLGAAQAPAKASVDKVLGGLCGMHRSWAVSQLVEAAQAEGALGEAEAKLLTPTEQLAYLRASTPAAEHAGLAGLAGERAAQLAKLGQLKAAYAAYQTSGAQLGLAPLDSAQAKEEAASFAAAAGAYFEQRAEVAAWAGQVAAAPEVTALAGTLTPRATSGPS